MVTDILKQHGWTSINVVDDWLVRAEMSDGERLDVLVSTTEYENGAISRAQDIDLGVAHACKTLAIEDVLISKLIADRFQDNADVESILVNSTRVRLEVPSEVDRGV